MIIAYTYKLTPSRQQLLVMDKHLEMLRLQYNFRIQERTEAFSQACSPVMGNYCDLKTQAECCPLTCSVSKNALYGDPWTSKGKKRRALAQQDADLPNLKRERPWYKAIQHHVLQQMLRRVENAFQHFFKGEGGYPKPKRRGRYRSWSYPPPDVRFEGNKVRLPGIGWCKFFQSRAFPDGFSTRTVTVRKKADAELGINIPLPVVHGKVTLKEPVARQGKSFGLPDEPENPRMEWEQLSLFEWRGE